MAMRLVSSLAQLTTKITPLLTTKLQYYLQKTQATTKKTKGYAVIIQSS